MTTLIGCDLSSSFAQLRSLEEFDAAVSVYGKTLEKDLLIKHHLGILYDQLLESNLLKIIQVSLSPCLRRNRSCYVEWRRLRCVWVLST